MNMTNVSKLYRGLLGAGKGAGSAVLESPFVSGIKDIAGVSAGGEKDTDAAFAGLFGEKVT